jgi:hypothetical protein
MWRTAFLRPAVVVLAGKQRHTLHAALRLRQDIRTVAGLAPVASLAEQCRAFNAGRLGTHPDAENAQTDVPRVTTKDSLYLLTSNISNPVLASSSEGADPGIICPSAAPAAFFAPRSLDESLPGLSGVSSPDAAASGSSAAPSTFVHEFFAKAHTEADRRSLFGDADPSTGLLLRFLSRRAELDAYARANTPAGQEVQSDEAGLCVVWVHCSMQGQFFLRDLIDAGVATTHVTKVNKDRLLFVLLVGEDNSDVSEDREEANPGVQPQLVSRSHLILHCKPEEL